MLASSASSKRTGSVQQGLTKFSKCVGNEHYMPVFLIAPNLNSEKKDIDNSRVIDSAKNLFFAVHVRTQLCKYRFYFPHLFETYMHCRLID